MPEQPSEQLRAYQATMRGATQQQKAQLRKSVDTETYNAICVAALAILDALPKDIALGTKTAALMLAATAYAEAAGQAHRLIDGKDAEVG